MDALRQLYIVIRLKDEISSQLKKINRTVDDTKSKLSKLTDFVDRHKAAIAGLGAGLSAIGYGGFRVFGESAKDFERAVLEMQARTGVTKKELERLTYTLKQLAKTNSNSFRDIASVLTVLHNRFGDLGSQTRTTAQAILDFAKVTGTDSVTAVDNLAVVMKAFNIPATRMYEVTDTLIAAQQRFGVQANYIISLLAGNSAALKELNLSFNEAVGLLSALEANGVNVARALMGLRSAAAKGIDVKKTLRELAEIRDSTERTRRATEIFGSYAGPGISRILEGGVKALDKYMLKLDDVRGTTLKASATIDESLSEQLGILRNNLNLLAVELGTALLPVLKSVVRIVKSFADTIQSLPAPIKGLLASLTALITIFSAVVGPLLLQVAAFSWLGVNLPQIIEGISALKVAMFGLSGSIWATISPLLPLIAVIGAVVGAILLLQHAWVHNWWDIQGKTQTAINTIRGAIDWLVNGIRTLIGWITAIPSKVQGEKSYLGRFVAWLMERFPLLKALAEVLSREIEYLKEAFGSLSDRVTSAMDLIRSVWDKTVGWIIDGIKDLIKWFSEIPSKLEEIWKSIAENPLSKAIQTAFQFTPIGAAMKAYEIIQPKIKPVIEKPQMDEKFYEEGSIKLKVTTPKIKPEVIKPDIPVPEQVKTLIKPEIERPKLSWLEQLQMRIKPLFELPKIPDIIKSVTYIPKVVIPKIRDLIVGVKYLPEIIQPRIPDIVATLRYLPEVIRPSIEPLTTMVNYISKPLMDVAKPPIMPALPTHPTTLPLTPSQNITKIEHKHIHAPVTIRIEGVKDPDKVAEVVERRLKQQFNAVGIY